MAGLSEQEIRDHCPHCDKNSQAFSNIVEETKNFHVVCDGHAVIEGHLLIIPKQHISCAGEFSSELFEEFSSLYQKYGSFIEKEYGSVSTFEHGKIGQTVFHAHIHLLPFSGAAASIVPEGQEHLQPVESIAAVKKEFEDHGQYLFFSIGKNNWLVDTALGAPRFFRDRFASALGRPERGNWKNMAADRAMVEAVKRENTNFMERYNHAHRR